MPSSLARLAALRGVQCSQTRRSSGHFFNSYNVEGFKKQMLSGVKEAQKTKVLWKRVSLFVGCPSILFAMWMAYRDHQAQHHKPKPEFVPYHYLAVRNRPFPWGDGNHSLFHNKKHNYVPGVGFEEEEEHH